MRISKLSIAFAIVSAFAFAKQPVDVVIDLPRPPAIDLPKPEVVQINAVEYKEGKIEADIEFSGCERNPRFDLRFEKIENHGGRCESTAKIVRVSRTTLVCSRVNRTKIKLPLLGDPCQGKPGRKLILKSENGLDYVLDIP